MENQSELEGSMEEKRLTGEEEKEEVKEEPKWIILKNEIELKPEDFEPVYSCTYVGEEEGYQEDTDLEKWRWRTKSMVIETPWGAIVSGPLKTIHTPIAVHTMLITILVATVWSLVSLSGNHSSLRQISETLDAPVEPQFEIQISEFKDYIGTLRTPSMYFFW